MTLLQRLAAVGLGRKDDEPGVAPPAPQVAAPSPVHAEYARRAAPQSQPRAPQGQLDAHGRQPVSVRSVEDEQLEIPAFLRRQAN